MQDQPVLTACQHFDDDRGFLEVLVHAERDSDVFHRPIKQIIRTRSASGVLRGLHYQWPRPMTKMVMCISGEILDVAVDLRQDSPTYKQHRTTVLGGMNTVGLHRFTVPAGYAHGFYVLQGPAEVIYLCDDIHVPENDHVVRWDDPEIGIEWPHMFDGFPKLSRKDENAPTLGELEGLAINPLPRMG